MFIRTKRASALRLLAEVAFSLVILCRLTNCRAEDSAARKNAENLTVMIIASFPGIEERSFGAGIIVAQRDSILYVVTAAHVVRTAAIASKIQVGLRWVPVVPAPDKMAKATFLKSEGDLAVLKIDLSEQAIPGKDVLSFSATTELSSLKQGDGIRPMGNPRNDHWVTCTEPDSISTVQNASNSIQFDEKCIEPGDSGGPLLDESWRVVGMVQKDQQPSGSALAIGAIMDKLRSWTIPVDLAPINAPDANTFSDLSVGIGVACGVTINNRIFCWGSNKGDALGIGTEKELNATIGLPLAGPLHFKTVSAGANDACALSLDGYAYCWGDFFDDGPKPQPSLVQSSSKFISLSKGANHACAITADGVAYCWGENNHGQLGDGSTQERSIPVPVAGGLHWLQLSATNEATCGIATDQRAYCWGENLSHLSSSGQNTVLTPAIVSGSHLFQQISAAGQHDIGGDGDVKYVCAIAVDATLFCWGGRVKHFSGVTLGADVSQPVEVSPGLHFLSISSGQTSACAVDSDRKVVCFGSMVYNSHDPNVPKPMLPIEGIVDAQKVNTSDTTACALKTTGKIFCWQTNIGNEDPTLVYCVANNNVYDYASSNTVEEITVCAQRPQFD